MWGTRHLGWLRKLAFEHAAQQIAFQGDLRAVEQAEGRGKKLEEQIAILLPSWSLARYAGSRQSSRSASWRRSGTLRGSHRLGK
jgi:hypothetical protein